MRYFWTAMTEFIHDTDLLKVSLRNVKINKDRMLSAARKNFCTVTELANYLVRIDKISFREAHAIVAEIVGYLNEKNLFADHISLEEINHFCQKLYGFTSKLTTEDVVSALNPVKNAQSKVSIGGTATSEVTHQLDCLEEQLREDEKLRQARLQQINQAKLHLEEEVNLMLY